MKKPTFIAISFFISVVLYGQKNIYMGFEGGLSFDKYELFDNGDQIISTPLLSGSFGINFSYPLNNYFSVETGVTLKQYTKGFAFSVIGANVGFTSGGIGSVQIPIRLRSRIPVVKDKIFFVPVIGYHHCFNAFNDQGGGDIRASGGSYSLDAGYNFTGDLTKSFPLMEAGIGLELRVLKTAFLTISASNFTGFRKVAQTDIVYTMDKGAETRATMYSKGDYSSFAAGIRFPIASIRPKKK